MHNEIHKKQRLSFFGHIKRHNTLEREICEGMMEGRRGREQPTIRWSQHVTDWRASQ